MLFGFSCHHISSPKLFSIKKNKRIPLFVFSTTTTPPRMQYNFNFMYLFEFYKFD